MTLYKLAMAYVWPEPRSLLFLSEQSAARYHEALYPNSSQPGRYFVSEAPALEVGKMVYLSFGAVRKRQIHPSMEKEKGITFRDADGAIFLTADDALAHVVKHGRWPAYADSEALRNKIALRDGWVQPLSGEEVEAFQQHFLREEEAGFYRD